MIYAFFLFAFVENHFLTKKFFLCVEINLTTGGPLYTCLVHPGTFALIDWKIEWIHTAKNLWRVLKCNFLDIFVAIFKTFCHTWMSSTSKLCPCFGTLSILMNIILHFLGWHNDSVVWCNIHIPMSAIILWLFAVSNVLALCKCQLEL